MKTLFRRSIVGLVLTIICAGIAWASFREARREASKIESAPAELQELDSPTLLSRYYPKTLDGIQTHIVRTATGFAPQFDGMSEPPIRDPHGPWKNHAKPVLATFPTAFDSAMRVRIKSDATTEFSARATPLNANRSAGELTSDGILLYRNAFKDADVLYRCSALKTEEFIVLRKCTAQELMFAWMLDLGHGTTQLHPRLTAAHTIEFCDETGVPRMRIDLPEGRDADGRRLTAGKELRYTLFENRLTLSADLSHATPPVIIDPSWSSTGNMSTIRSDHAADRLPDGRVLVSGGYTGGLAMKDPLSSSEIFNPQTGTWSATGSMNEARDSHKLFRLSTGKMLAFGPGTSCELYNPATGNWTITSNSNFAVSNAVVMNDGRILSADRTDAEIYDPQTGLWTVTGSLNIFRQSHTLTALADGRILAATGRSNTSRFLSSCEIFDPAAGTWALTGSVTQSRQDHTAVLLGNGTVLVCGGFGEAFSGLNTSELFNPATGTWASTGSLGIQRSQHRAVLIGNRLLIAAGSTPSSPMPNKTCELFTPETGSWANAATLATEKTSPTLTLIPGNRALIVGGNNSCEIFDPRRYSITGHAGRPIQIELFADLSQLVDLASFSVDSQPLHGSTTSTSTTVTYTATAGYVGTDSFTYQTSDSLGNTIAGSVNIELTNLAPKVTISAAPRSEQPNRAASFSATGTDPDTDPLTYSWNFGDNSPPSAEQNPTHTYSSVGTYNIVVTVTDPAGAFGVATQTITVSKAPTVRLQTSEVVAFATQAFTFDASTSTDPENAIAIYSWDFGDGTPLGSGQVISKIYELPGEYIVTLLVTDSAGVTSSLQRVITVLPPESAGLFNGFFHYKTKWNRNTVSKDSLSLEAQVNVGELVVGTGSVVALDIVEQHFAGTMDRKLRDFVNPNTKWQLSANVRRQPTGTVRLKVKIKNASLGSGFNLAGATAGADLHDIVSKDIPVRVTIDGREFELSVPSDFKFSAGGRAASGEGEE